VPAAARRLRIAMLARLAHLVSLPRSAAMLAALGAAFLALSPAGAAEFRSVGVAVAILYDGPSAQARRLWLAPRGTPFEVLATTPPWVRVRDASGDVAWIDRGDLAAQRTVVARGQASVRSAGQEGAEVLFVVERGVGLELLDPAAISGWLRVRHRSGASGWIRAADIWGV
jgi:SH3-like domain-containing protein